MKTATESILPWLNSPKAVQPMSQPCFRSDGMMTGGVNAGVLKNNTRWTARRPEWAMLQPWNTKLDYIFSNTIRNPRFEAVRRKPVSSTFMLPQDYAGAFNVWDLTVRMPKSSPKPAIPLELEITFDEAGSSDFTVCLSRKWYDDEWGKRWVPKPNSN